MTEDDLRNCLKSDSAEIRNLATETLRLRGAIEKHRENTGHELCWLNDVELWRSLDGNTANYPHATLPVREEFLHQCSRFYESRMKGTPYAEPAPKKTITD